MKRHTGGGSSIFDSIGNEDQIIAFFPCVRFEDQVLLWFRGESYSQRNWDYIQKLKYDISIHDELNELYKQISMMAVVCLKRSIPLIIENPYSVQHYLQKYWCIKPKLVDKNRRERGDYYEKPSQFWFINREPSNNLVFDALAVHKKKTVDHAKAEDGVSSKVNRSMISKDYANRFIREFII